MDEETLFLTYIGMFTIPLALFDMSLRIWMGALEYPKKQEEKKC